MKIRLEKSLFWARARRWGGILPIYLLLQTPALAEYRLASGDVLELTVAGFEDLKQKAPIGVDGEFVLPLIGPVKAAGLTLRELSQAVRQAYSSSVIQQRVPGSPSEPVVIASNEITLQIAEYRPIYVNGDVAKPGELLYRPGMTLRQAVTMAGGYDTMRFGVSNPLLEATRLRGEIEALWAQLAADQALAWRLNIELTGDKVPFPDFSNAPVSRSIISQIKKTEEDQLKTRAEDLAKERASIQQTIAQADKRLALLAEQMKKEEAASQADTEDFERVSGLFERGNIAVTRLSDARKTMLLSATRILQTSSATTQLERERETLRRSLEELDDKRRITLNTELQQANARIGQSQAKIAALEEEFRYVGGLRSQLTAGENAQPEVTIMRKGDNGVERIIAQEDESLLPGDVVEVSLRARFMPSPSQ